SGEQGKAKRAFDFSQGLAQGWLGQVQHAGRCAQTAASVKLDQQLQMPKAQAGNQMSGALGVRLCRHGEITKGNQLIKIYHCFLLVYRPILKRRNKTGDPIMERRSFCLTVSAALAAAPLQVFASQAYPSRSVRIISPYAAGGGPDVQLRQAGPVLGEALGQTIVIENKVGAAGVLAAQY